MVWASGVAGIYMVVRAPTDPAISRPHGRVPSEMDGHAGLSDSCRLRIVLRFVRGYAVCMLPGRLGRASADVTLGRLCPDVHKHMYMCGLRFYACRVSDLRVVLVAPRV